MIMMEISIMSIPTPTNTILLEIKSDYSKTQQDNNNDGVIDYVYESLSEYDENGNMTFSESGFTNMTIIMMGVLMK